MTTVRYEASTHRLRLEGVCRDDDTSTIQDAIDTFVSMSGGHLVIDLTAVTAIHPTIAADLVAAVHAARSQGNVVTLIRKHRTPVDDAIIAAESEDGQ